VLTRTVVEADMHDTVLDQANVILRYLLGAHLLSCLASPRVVFYSIDISVLCKLAEGLMFLDIPPGKPVAIGTPDEREAEYRQFFI
jgi:hypothetical protein